MDAIPSLSATPNPLIASNAISISNNNKNMKTKAKTSKATSNKQSKVNHAQSVNWNRIFDAVDVVTHGYNSLFDILNDEWNRSTYTDPLAFRRDFVERYVKRKTCSDPDQARAYANRVACEAGFRIRGKGAGRKVGKATNKPKASMNKPTKASQIDLSAMPKGELQKLILDAASRI